MATQTVHTENAVEEEAALGPCAAAVAAHKREIAMHQARLVDSQSKLAAVSTKYHAILAGICVAHGVTPPQGAVLSASKSGNGVDITITS